MSTILILSFCFHQFQGAWSAPVHYLNQNSNLPTGNHTALYSDRAQSWVAPGPVRSSWEILYSCLTALFTCSYSVLPMNIPGPLEKWPSIYLRKAKWMLLTVLMPELVIYVAWKQGQDAKKLKRDLETALEKHHSKSDEKIPCPKVSVLYCHFALMGGLVIDVSSIHNTLTKLVITPSGLCRLAELGNFIPISDQQIRDLDRWDTLGKSIAIMQAFWIIVQCIGRGVARLPISLLELNTCVNVGFAFCLRLLWNEKPFDIQTPIFVDDKISRELTALVLMDSAIASPWGWGELGSLCEYLPVSFPSHGSVKDVFLKSQLHLANFSDGQIRPGSDKDLRMVDPTNSLSPLPSEHESSLPRPPCPPEAVEDVWDLPAPNEEDPWCFSHTSRPEEISKPGTQLARVAQPEEQSQPLQPGVGTITFISRLPEPEYRRPSIHVSNACDVVCTLKPGQGLVCGIGPRPNRFEAMQLSKKDVERWNLASSALDILRANSEISMPRGKKIDLPDDSNFEAYRLKHFSLAVFADRAVNIEFWDPVFEKKFEEFLSTLALLGLQSRLITLLALFLALHGGIHLSAWEFSFPTHREELLWRLSCFGLVLGFTPIALAAWLSRFLQGDELPDWALSGRRWYQKPILMYFDTAFMTVICITAISSMYLILESFFALRYEPVGVFAKLEWAAFLPSLG